MAASKAEGHVTWPTTTTYSAITTGSNATSDAVTLAADTYALAVSIYSAHQGTPTSGDTVDWYILWSTGDVTGDTNESFDTTTHAMFIGQHDNNVSSGCQTTVDLPISTKAFKVYAVNNGASTVNAYASYVETKSGNT